MNIHYLESSEEAGRRAAEEAAQYLQEAIRRSGGARIAVATGASQYAFLDHLTKSPDIDWSKITMFHLDEYIGLPPDHHGSLRRYLRERVVDKVHPGRCMFIDGNASEPQMECRRLGEIMAEGPCDAAFIGIGENGHVAFNDPPADFQVDQAYIIVNLDDVCRRQQVGEGWFTALSDVPSRAITMSIRQILRARKIFCVVPELRKADAVRACVEEEISPLRPASILRSHANIELYLDPFSASKLSRQGAVER
ncbi:MAG TPA: glucosamine-6-phosphate deaminase [bacterium]|nr:glucosamine-6-phosphate deaminase [bacterium]